MVKPLPPLPPKGERVWTLGHVLRWSGQAVIVLGAILALVGWGRSPDGLWVVLVGLIVVAVGVVVLAWESQRREHRAQGRGRG